MDHYKSILTGIERAYPQPLLKGERFASKEEAENYALHSTVAYNGQPVYVAENSTEGEPDQQRVTPYLIENKKLKPVAFDCFITPEQVDSTTAPGIFRVTDNAKGLNLQGLLIVTGYTLPEEEVSIKGAFNQVLITLNKGLPNQVGIGHEQYNYFEIVQRHTLSVEPRRWSPWKLHSLSQEQVLQASLNVATELLQARTGVAGGLASLDSAGKVPATQLPSYVDDVLEATWVSTAPTTGIIPGAHYYNTATKKIHTGRTATTLSAGTEPESGKIYVCTDNNGCYRWSGTNLIEISKSLVIGTTPGTAYDGAAGAALSTQLARIPQVLTGTTTTGMGSGALTLYFTATRLDGSVATNQSTSLPAATAATAGVMTASDKVKLTTLNKAGEFDGAIKVETQPDSPSLDDQLDALKTPGVYKLCDSYGDATGLLMVANCTGFSANGTPVSIPGAVMQSRTLLAKYWEGIPNTSVLEKRCYYPIPQGANPPGWTPWQDEYRNIVDRAVSKVVEQSKAYTDSTFLQTLNLTL